MPSPSSHLRAPLLWLLLPLAAGFAAAKHWPLPAAGPGPFLGAAAILALVALVLAPQAGRRAHAGWAIALAGAVGLTGFVLLHARDPFLQERPNRPPREVTLQLEVTRLFSPRAGSRSLSGLGRITAAGRNDGDLPGRTVQFSAIRKVSVLPRDGARYVVQGILQPLSADPVDAGFNDYLDNLGIHLQLARAIIRREVSPPPALERLRVAARGRLERILRRGLERHAPIASLYLAMVLGEKAMLASDQQDAFMRSGTFHIFSVSGLHVGVIAGAIYTGISLLRVPRRTTTLLTLALLWLYVDVTGGGAPSIRSYLMIFFVFGARAFRLPGNHLAALTVAALVTLLLDPMQLFTTGFQMSYLVMLALMAMATPLGDKWAAGWHPFSNLPRASWRWRHHVADFLGRKFLVAAAGCLVAFLASTPAGIAYFQLFSPGALAANLVVIPAASLALISGFVSLVAGLAGLGPLSALFNSAAAVILLAINWAVSLSTQLPGSWLAAHFRAGWMAPAAMAAMAAVLLAGAAVRWSPRWGGYWPPVALLAATLIFLVKFG
ncbi:MAG TPA: ComEC/Rec2 family competence protein [Lacunisphaera sp.]|nr:ComEC/Rec2 family competence protein [Lacunisphaera sp.]